jgi:anti-sigma factor RsiW
MDHNIQLKVQAWLDGELPEAEAREVAKWLEQDREAAALAGELRNTRQALSGLEADVRLPESREFFWSKIEREIRRLETPAPAAAREQSYWAQLRRFLVPASALAAVLLGAVVLLRPTPPAALTTSPAFETASADSGTFTYRDESARTTLVWLSYPADNDVADDNEMGIVE